LLEIDADNANTAPTRSGYQAFLLQQAERLAERGTAHSELRRELDLSKRVSGGVGARVDPFAQSFCDVMDQLGAVLPFERLVDEPIFRQSHHLSQGL
jgi:hypothetical protein